MDIANLGQNILGQIIASVILAGAIIIATRALIYLRYRLAVGKSTWLIVKRPFTYHGVKLGVMYLVEAARRFDPNFVVGVNRGGAIVGGILCKYLGSRAYVHVLEVTDAGVIGGAEFVKNAQIGTEKRVLLVDDRTNSGLHLKLAWDHLRQHCTELRAMTFADTTNPKVSGMRLDHYAYRVRPGVPLPWEPSKPSEFGKELFHHANAEHAAIR